MAKTIQIQTVCLKIFSLKIVEILKIVTLHVLLIHYFNKYLFKNSKVIPRHCTKLKVKYAVKKQTWSLPSWSLPSHGGNTLLINRQTNIKLVCLFAGEIAKAIL